MPFCFLRKGGSSVTTRGIILIGAILALSAGLDAESVEGTVVIRKKLTKRRVTAPVPMYQRGTTVKLNVDQSEDPLAFERERVALWIEGQMPDSAPQPTTRPIATMSQENRTFSPETLVIAAGSKVSFPNLDPIFHNVFSLSKTRPFDLGNYPKGETRFVTFPEPGIVSVGCQLHSNMSATIVVTPNRWNARADRDGRFVIQGLPPGKYTIVAWHKAAGFFRQPIQIEAGHDTDIEFLIPIDEDGSKLIPKSSDSARNPDSRTIARGGR
jgi:plastocyanin